MVNNCIQLDLAGLMVKKKSLKISDFVMIGSK